MSWKVANKKASTFPLLLWFIPVFALKLLRFSKDSFLNTRLSFAIPLSALLVILFYYSSRQTNKDGQRLPILIRFGFPKWFILYIVLFAIIPILELNTAMISLSSYSAVLVTKIISVFVGISVYDLALLLILPLLRKNVSAASCAALWIIPPSAAYIGFRNILAPIFFLRVRSFPFVLVGLIWLLGFLLSVAWKTVSHLRFRKRMLTGSSDATERDRRILHEVRTELGGKPVGELLISPSATAPLSIGLFRNTVKIVLPEEKTYSDEELRMILTHEVIHLARGDNASKFFMALLSSLGWFIPLLRIGYRKVSEEIELCCDEFSTCTMRPEEKKQYACLLLTNAAEEKGYTTCLSASADCLRYRMQRIMEQKKRRSGVIIAAVLAFLLTFSLGSVSIAYNEQPMTDLIPQNAQGFAPVFMAQAREKLHLPWGEVQTAEEEITVTKSFACERPEELLSYLSSFHVHTITEDYFRATEQTDRVLLNFKDEGVYITIFPLPESSNGNCCIVRSENGVKTCYITDKPMDMDYLRSFIGEESTGE